MATYNLQDLSFGLGLSETKSAKLEDVLQINNTFDGKTNNYKNGSTVILNSDRLILNSKKDYVMICGKEGVMLTSPKSIHLDCDNDIHIFSNTEVYIGLPNKGAEYDFDNQRTPKTKAQATVNSKYEPMVLGLKLVNLLEDLLVIMKNATITTPAGQGFMSPEMMYNLACLQARLPEMLSTYAFVDGISHEGVDPEPPLPSGVAPTTGNTVKVGSSGTAVATTQATNAGPSQNNTSSTPATNVQATTQIPPGGTAPVVANNSTTNPATPTNNLDGPPPTQASSWVPNQVVATGVEVPTPQTSPPQSISWIVKKADTINSYTGTYKNLLGIDVTYTDTNLDNVLQFVRDSARGEF